MNGQQQVRRRRGRPSKGDRQLVKGDVPVFLAECFKADARQLGISQADRLAEILAEHYADKLKGAMRQAS